MMNAATFALLPRGAVFINTARGSLVDEEALIAALTARGICLPPAWMSSPQ